MTATTICLFVAGAFLLALGLRIGRVMLREERWLPREIANGRLMFSEQVFTGPVHIPIVARIDRAYAANGQLHLVELKVRREARVHEADIIELSAQRVAVAASTGLDVSMKGYVVLEHPISHRRTVRAAVLLSDEQVANLVARRHAILDGFERPKESCVKLRCAQCEYRGECKDGKGFKVLLFVRP